MSSKRITPIHGNVGPHQRAQQPIPFSRPQLETMNAVSKINRTSTPQPPPVFRPQSVPKVLQTRMVSVREPRDSNTLRQPVAPPVYRPEPKKIIQPKLMTVRHTPPSAPPVYRPDTRKLAQQKTATPAYVRAQAKAPPVYRPQPTSRVLQNKSSQSSAIAHAPGKTLQSPRSTAATRQEVVQPARQPFGAVRNVVQRIITLADQPTSPVNDISDVDAAMLEVTHGASRAAIGFLRAQARLTANHPYADWAAAVSAATLQVNAIARLKRSHGRNLKSKAEPSRPRKLLDSQKKHSYGFSNPEINEGILKGKYRRGFASQPFLTLNKEDFEGAVVASDYDALIAIFRSDKAHTQQEIAEAILVLIDHGTFEAKAFTPQLRRAISTIVQLTQFIEPFVNRIPGSDKWARACFVQILNNESSFQIEFNRRNGRYLPARAVSGGSKYGGQQTTRALLEIPKAKDKATFSGVFTSGVAETLAEMSDSSDEDEDEAITDMSSSSSTKAKGSKRVHYIVPNDPSAPYIDHLSYFQNLELENGITMLNGYQAGQLFDLFGGDPHGNRVNFAGITFTIVKNPKGTLPTQYNPLGLVLGLRVYLRGG